jgi:uncharacterized protein (DUF488 family)
MSKQLFTVGYEGTTVDEFVAHLRSKNIDCVVDVREVPFSRKPGFSKTRLARRLSRAKIRYVHLRELGAPKYFRDALKSTGDYSGFFKRMDKHLARKKDAIEEAYHYVVNTRCCLMCFEHSADECHRKVVARKIRDRDGNGLRIEDI